MFWDRDSHLQLDYGTDWWCAFGRAFGQAIQGPKFSRGSGTAHANRDHVCHL